MSEVVPTVTVETKNGPVLINMSDYDPATHVLHGSSKSSPLDDAINVFSREAAYALLEEKGIPFDKRIGDKKLQELVASIAETGE